jgi:hypothetical protein
MVASECRKWGLVHVIEAMAAKGGFARADDPDIVALNCRMAGELGADMIKTDWCEATRFTDIARQSLAPIAVAGGSAMASLEDTVRFATDAIEAGATGLMFGRNVSSRPTFRRPWRDWRQWFTIADQEKAPASRVPGLFRKQVRAPQLVRALATGDKSLQHPFHADLNRCRTTELFEDIREPEDVDMNEIIFRQTAREL